MNRLGIIDWGIGGIGLVKLLKQERGDVAVTYLSDTGVTPYGKMKRSELVSRLDSAISYLKSGGVTHVIIGCNAASTAVTDLRDHRIPIEGVINAAITDVVKRSPARLGLIGGRRTVLSGVYRRAFAKHGIAVKQRIAQPLSGLIEGGDVSSETLRGECRRILTPLRNSSHILLACTHYPAIAPVMADFVSSDTEFIDPAPALLAAVRRWRLPSGGRDIYLTTGSPEKMKSAALGAFGWQIAEAARVSF